MKYLYQFTIILSVTFVGYILSKVMPFKFPPSIYGLLLMFLLLSTGILPINMVRDSGKFLIKFMPIMFVPSAVGLMKVWGDLYPILIPVCVITFISTIIVMVISGKITEQIIIKKQEKINEKYNG